MRSSSLSSLLLLMSASSGKYVDVIAMRIFMIVYLSSNAVVVAWTTTTTSNVVIPMPPQQQRRQQQQQLRHHPSWLLSSPTISSFSSWSSSLLWATASGKDDDEESIVEGGAPGDDDGDDDDDEDDDDYSDLDAMMKDATRARPSSMFGKNLNKPRITVPTPDIGIDLGSMLDPYTEEERDELMADVTKALDDAVNAGIQDIKELRQKMKESFERRKRESQRAIDYKAEIESERALNKIDSLLDDFFEKTKIQRQSTKLVANADNAMEGKGLEMGTWGTVDGASVVTTGGSGGGSAGLLGSVDASSSSSTTTTKNQEQQKEITTTEQHNEPRILVVADSDQDPYAKELVSALTEKLNSIIPGIHVNVIKPSGTMPIGGENAACLILFCTSINDEMTLNNALDRLLRKTIQPNTGDVSNPPTQIVAISSVGTDRTNKMPYSMQNLMNGGKLDKRRRMEEAVISTVNNRLIEPWMDYTICKLGEIKDNAGSQVFDMSSGDTLDGSITVDTAATILSQAIAYQPTARNTTFGCVGDISIMAKDKQELEQDIINDYFLRLDGPELYREDIVIGEDENSIVSYYKQLAEYIREWAFMIANTGKGLTTPVYAEGLIESNNRRPIYPGIERRSGARLLFIPTATGKNYLSRNEELVREKSGQSTNATPLPPRNKAKEGGVEVFVETTTRNVLRIRAKRTNYANDAIIKELSEQTILSRFKESIELWKKEYKL